LKTENGEGEAKKKEENHDQREETKQSDAYIKVIIFM